MRDIDPTPPASTGIRTITANGSRRIDPLKADPTRTAGLRRSFMTAMTTRLTILRRRIIALVEKEDAFGLARQSQVVNVFCPTGPGGGVDPTCSPGGGLDVRLQIDKGRLVKSPILYRGTDAKDPFAPGPQSEKGLYFFDSATSASAYGKVHQARALDRVLDSTQEYGRDILTEARDKVRQAKYDESDRIDSLLDDGALTADQARTMKARMRSIPDDRLVAQALARSGVVAVKETDHVYYVVDLGELVSNVVSPTINERWSFRTTPEQLEEFEDWLMEQFADVVLDLNNPDAYFQEFIRRGYEQGAGRAFTDVNPVARGTPQFYAGTRDQFLRTAFAQPVAKERVKVLVGRVLTELKGVSQGMATRMIRTLADGLVRGESPRDVARRLTTVLDGDVHRAHTIARTETIRAHAEGQLDALELMGVTEVGVAVEWSTAKLRVCPLCQELDGITLSVQESRGMIPRHPNCRCSWIPANVGESDSKQIRTKRGIEQAIRESIRRELPASKQDDAKALKARVKDTSWTGADTSVSESRPKSILENYDPSQPRHPAGSPRGGEFASSRDTGIDAGFPSLSGESRSKIRKELDDLEALTGVKFEKFREIEGGTDVIAHGGGAAKVLGLNPRIWKDRESYTGWRNGVESGQFVDTTVRGMLAHEFGHLLSYHHVDDVSTFGEIFSSWEPWKAVHRISRYAESDQREMTAEAFVYFLNHRTLAGTGLEEMEPIFSRWLRRS